MSLARFPGSRSSTNAFASRGSGSVPVMSRQARRMKVASSHDVAGFSLNCFSLEKTCLSIVLAGAGPLHR